ncbi:MAG: DNA polymerase III subunit delta [Breznakia sp.]
MNYVLCGEEAFLIKKKIKEIIKECDADKMSVVFYDALKHDIKDVITDCYTVSFFSSQKVVVLENCQFLSAKTSLENEVVLLDYVQHPLPSTTLILSVYNKLDTRKKIGKELKKVMKVLQFNTLEEFDRKKLIEAYLEKYKIAIVENAKQELYRRLPFDMTQVYNELEKLRYYGRILDAETIIALITQPLEDNVFKLSNAIMAKDISRCFHCLQDFKRNNVEVVSLISLVASQFRFLFQVKTLELEGYSKNEIISYLHAHPFRVEKNLQHAYERSLEDIQNVLLALANLDQEIKMGKVDKQQGFEMLLLQHCI